MASSLFARHYLGNRVFFLFLRVLRCFTSPSALLQSYLIQIAVTGHYPGRVSPFGYPWVTAYLRLSMAFRSLSRPSSAISALASTLRSSSLDLRFSTRLLRLFHHASNHLGFSNSLYFYFYYACFPVQFSSCALMKYLPKLSLGFARFSSALPNSALLRHFKTIQNFRKNSISSLFRLSPALWTFVRGHSCDLSFCVLFHDSSFQVRFDLGIRAAFPAPHLSLERR